MSAPRSHVGPLSREADGTVEEPILELERAKKALVLGKPNITSYMQARLLDSVQFALSPRKGSRRQRTKMRSHVQKE